MTHPLTSVVHIARRPMSTGRALLCGPLLVASAMSSCKSNEPRTRHDLQNSFAVHLNELRGEQVKRDRSHDRNRERHPARSRRIPDLRFESQHHRDHDRSARRHGHLYVGGNFGFTDGHESGGDLQNDLNRRTPAGRSVVVDLDDTDVGYKAYLGYRFVQPFAVELGYTGLEGPDSTIRTAAVDANLVADVQDLHPITGRGPTLSLVGYPVRCGRFEMFARAGVWYWTADVKVNVGNTVVHKDPNGWDPLVGVGAQFRLFRRVRARVEYERYFLRDADIDLLSLGLTVGF